MPDATLTDLLEASSTESPEVEGSNAAKHSRNGVDIPSALTKYAILYAERQKPVVGSRVTGLIILP
jgi:hypothetical protein